MFGLLGKEGRSAEGSGEAGARGASTQTLAGLLRTPVTRRVCGDTGETSGLCVEVTACDLLTAVVGFDLNSTLTFRTPHTEWTYF